MSEDEDIAEKFTNADEEDKKLVGSLMSIFFEATKLYTTNMSLLTVPYMPVALCTTVGTLSLKSNFSLPVLSVGFLAGSLISAACIQYSRKRKSQLRESYEEIWDNMPGPNDDPVQKEIDAWDRQDPAIFLRQAFERKADKSKFFISKKDFDITDPHKRLPVVMGVAAGIAGVLINPALITMAPFFFLTCTQQREYADSGRIVSRAQSSFEIADQQFRLKYDLPPVAAAPRVIRPILGRF